MSSQDGYDWPNGCGDERWPTGAEPTAAESWVETYLRRLEWEASIISDPAYQQEQRERNANLRDLLDIAIRSGK